MKGVSLKFCNDLIKTINQIHLGNVETRFSTDTDMSYETQIHELSM